MINSMKELAKKDLVEGYKAFERFDALVGKVLSVPRNEILRRDAEHKKRSMRTLASVDRNGTPLKRKLLNEW